MAREEGLRTCSWLLVLAWMAGCVTGSAGSGRQVFYDLPSQPGVARPAFAPRPKRATSPKPREGRDGSRFFGLLEEKKDGFQILQESAGLEKDDWHEAGEELETDNADTRSRSLITPQTRSTRLAMWNMTASRKAS
jgi:hypothetical protein